MAKVLVNCEDCGHVRVNSQATHLRVCIESHVVSFVYQCPTCGVRDALALSCPDQVHLLLAAGVDLVPWHLPSTDHHHQGPITMTHIALFFQWLAAL